MHKHPGKIGFIVGLLMTLALPAVAQQPAATGGAVVAFVNVNVVPMDTERVLTNQTVVVEGSTIVAMGPSGSQCASCGHCRLASHRPIQQATRVVMALQQGFHFGPQLRLPAHSIEICSTFFR